MKNTFSSFWLVFFSTFFSLTWLLPNHTQPWLAFHSEAWAGLLLSVVAVTVMARKEARLQWGWPVLLVLAVALVPWAQLVTGKISSLGVAWINFLFLFGLGISILTGWKWESNSPRQCGDFLFLSITLAAFISVGIQLCQWLKFDLGGTWVLYGGGSRFYANLAQPNQLASLLTLGLIGLLWGYARAYTRGSIAFIAASYLLFGISLTESRTAWINLGLIAAFSLLLYRGRKNTRFNYGVISLLLLFVSFYWFLPEINEFLFSSSDFSRRDASESARFAIWRVFSLAVLESPFSGFGWGQIAHAQFYLVDSYPALGGTSFQSHNLFLDLLIYNGVLIGAPLCLLIAKWLIDEARQPGDGFREIQYCAILVLLVHAMLEYPLHYAYFLLPAGLWTGVLFRARVKQMWGFNTGRIPGAFLAVCALLGVLITVVDYLKVERSFYGLRFEMKGIPAGAVKEPPEVIFLTQWRDHIVTARKAPEGGLSEDELKRMVNIVSTTPSAYLMFKLAANFAVNDKPVEAEDWLSTLCKTSPAEHCRILKVEWATLSEKDEKYAVVKWE